MQPGPQGLACLGYGEYIGSELLFCPDERDAKPIELEQSGWNGKSTERGIGYDYRQTSRIQYSPSKIDVGPQPDGNYDWLKDTAPGLWMKGGWSLISDRWSMDNRHPLLENNPNSFDNTSHDGGFNVWYMDGRVERCPVIFYARYAANSWPTGFEIFDGGLTPPQDGIIEE
jgi:prepilin-type processing-associated H-X9-DG protein